MTAEIGILNRQGVALAADSAVTIGIGGRQKVLNSANKLFNLVKGLPLGLMIYGRGDFLGVPWEIIVHEYRKQFDEKYVHNNLDEYAKDFIDSLNNKKFFSENSYGGYVTNLITALVEEITSQTKGLLSEKYPNIEVAPEIVLEEFKLELEKKIEEFNNLEFSEGFEGEDIEELLNNSININVSNNIVCELFNISEDMKNAKINNLMNELKKDVIYLSSLVQTKDVFFNYSGVVIAGFGEEELFPVLHEYYVEGIINNKLKYKLNKVTKIYAESGENKHTSAITPFAQQEMVHSVLTGIEPNLEGLIFRNLNEVLNNTLSIVDKEFECEKCAKKEESIKKIIEKSQNELNNMIDFINHIRRIEFINPILEMVDSLPKDELATMAETLVNLTSFKRKITMDTETVGGPIDVAIISKSEGFIWIKRKHYFEKKLNSGYFNK